MRTLISLGIAFVVMVVHLLIGAELTPSLSSETALNILVMGFLDMTVITWLVLKHRRGRTAMFSRIMISLGAGVANFAFLYVILFVPNPRYLVKDAAIELVVSASFVSLVVFVLLSLPPPLGRARGSA